jgi:hypothetical protein
MPRMFDCSSTLIARYGYDPTRLEMTIEFKDGGTWVYRDVPEECFAEFLSAPSKGKYLRANIWHKHESEAVA